MEPCSKLRQQLNQQLHKPMPTIPNTFPAPVYDNDHCTRAFAAHTAFRPITTKVEFDDLLSSFPIVLLLGVFDWSNYSHDVFREMCDEHLWFQNHTIGLGVTCLGNPDKLQDISSAAYSYFTSAITEPLIFCFINGSMKRVFEGPCAMAELRNWMQEYMSHKE